MDYYSELRQRMVNCMQESLKQIRQVLDLGVQEFSDIVGLTRQSLNNLESAKVRMSTVQFLAVCAVIDHMVKSQPKLRGIIYSILNSYYDDDFTNMDDILFFDINQDDCLLDKWFLCFPDESKLIFQQNNIVDDIISNYKIFLDDTAIQEIFNSEIGRIICEKMQNEGKKFIVPMCAVESIQNQILNDDPYVVKTNRQAIKNLKTIQDYGICDLRGEQSDQTIIYTLASVFIKFKLVNRIALITQNETVANKIIQINNEYSDGFPLLVLKFSESKLKKWEEGATEQKEFYLEDNELIEPELTDESEVDNIVLNEAKECPNKTNISERDQEAHNNPYYGWDVL